MHVSVDTTRCCGTGMCVLIAPEVFEQRDEDGLVLLLTPSPGEELEEVVREAAAACPTTTIRLKQEGSA